MASLVERRKVTPPQLAKEWGVSTSKVVALIKSGELIAINLASSREKRPRYAIDRADVAAFEEARRVIPVEQPAKRRRPSKPVKDYFAGGD